MVSSKRFWFSVILLLAIIFVGIGWQKVFAQAEESRYFPETGHWVTGEFLLKYEAIVNPSELYGAPITERFEDPISGRTIQYFEKVRFELHPELSGDLRVKLSTLGDYLYEEGNPISVIATAPACRTFDRGVEHPVCYAFLDFFEANGEVEQFGYPVSGFEIHDGWIVQYFQNARFEWHPENPTGKRVTISNLGYRYFYDRREDPTLLNPVLDNDAPDIPVFELRAYAFAGTPVLPLHQSQTLYFIVRDQYHNPVANADVDFTVTLPDGNISTYKAGKTNEDGLSTLSFRLTSSTPGIVQVRVKITYDNGALTTDTKTSFSLWW